MSLFTRKSAIATLSGALLTSVLVISIAEAGPRGSDRGGAGGQGGERSVERAFERFDISEDDVVTLDEFTANTADRAERRFNRQDDDEDGVVSLEEATTNRRGEQRADYSDIAAEIVACVADLAVEDENVVVPDADRFIAPEDRFNAKDTDGDGELSLEEVQANALDNATEKFNDMDSDASGDLSLEEFAAAKERRRATRQAIRSCIAELTEEE